MEDNTQAKTEKLQCMKPSKLDLEKESHKQRLEEWMESPRYIAEEKIDGCHYFCAAGKFLSTQTSKRTGENVDKTDNFPHLVEGFLKANLGQVILDGEIYYPGTNSFYATQITGSLGSVAIQKQKEDLGWISYKVFDVLRDHNGNWLYYYPWSKRRAYLEQVMARLTKECEYFHLIAVVRSKKKAFLEKCLAEGKEGIILKDTKGLYVPGKRPAANWIKIKVHDTDDVVITGFEPPVREYTGGDYDNWPYWENEEPVSKNYYHKLIGSIRFGKYQNGKLVDMGRCTGIDDSTRRMLTENQEEYIGQVIEISYMEKTPEGFYRHPNFVRIHSDKNPEECIIEGS